MPLALLALAVVAFGIGTTEFVSMGLLPQIADGVGVSVPQAGNIVSAYALGVVLGAPLLTGLGARVPHKKLLLWLTGLFVIGNTASAFAPGFGTLFAARVLAGLPHGALFGVGAVVASRLVAPERAARAVSMMFLGLTVANIVGVPAGTALGQALGWRAAYLAVAGIGLVALAALVKLVPHQPRGEGAGIGRELRAMGNRHVAIMLATAVVGFGGCFAVYSYLVPMLTEVTGMAESSTTFVLALYGVGMTLGTLVAGPLTDRAPRPTLYGGLIILAMTLAAFYFAIHVLATALLCVLLIGAVGSLITTPVQMLLMAKADEAPTMAAASNHSAFNLANAGGAWLGGLVISAGWGWTAPALVGTALAVGGLALALVAGRMDGGVSLRGRTKVVASGAPVAVTAVETAEARD
ncbi:putative major facilitator superfamily permease [Streptomyces sp. Tu6071]|uniref:MFS transporter n=1 Tax=Streptomyces evansiae TaxID=3075535 RepID=A0ABD5E9W0_9ACTN|nr:MULTISPECIES: MFS transporter [unclassified Streptomyces]ASY34013.1 MFS transporter [Streptomyces sp. CLI2509]EGJ76250.1 putative major facilitator superfamily permease [Streptomyces sp. Tu6071]MDT0417392.1 MFS transporter [Streptomyces sp. DSM 41982]MYX19898.1 MFS transporter [Streptomyces sp. SID8380]SCD51781.1 MFS transporter, DHA1 family, inner membrane transport protein [Streptomyces sp. SolWspMP-sol7th]